MSKRAHSIEKLRANVTGHFFSTITMSGSDDDDSLSDVSADNTHVQFVLPTTNPTMNDFRRVRILLLKFLDLAHCIFKH